MLEHSQSSRQTVYEGAAQEQDQGMLEGKDRVCVTVKRNREKGNKSNRSQTEIAVSYGRKVKKGIRRRWQR